MSTTRARLGYPAEAGGRDLRFDFMRGFAMLSVVAAHFEVFSWFNFLFWERLGIISAAEMFVIASGLVLGLVNRRVVDRTGMEDASLRLLRRAFVLYRAQVVVILIIVLLARFNILDMTALTTFTDRLAEVSYPMIPAPQDPWHVQLGQILLLRSSPHQIQILSLYVLLLAFAPALLWLLRNRLLGVYFALSWALYFAAWLAPDDHLILGMQFEYAFPLLGWQILFTHALAVGYFRTEIGQWLADSMRRRIVVIGCALLAFGFFLFAQTSPNPSFPAWSRLPLISPETFYAWYDTYFVKDRLPLPRLLNVATFFAAFYALLTYFWQPINRALGWLLIPLGEASLYVFLMHIVFIGLIDQLPGYFDGNPTFAGVWPVRIWINTALYVGTILGLC